MRTARFCIYKMKANVVPWRAFIWTFQSHAVKGRNEVPGPPGGDINLHFALRIDGKVDDCMKNGREFIALAEQALVAPLMTYLD